MKKLTNILAVLMATALLFGLCAVFAGCGCDSEAETGTEPETAESAVDLPEDEFADYVTPSVINGYINTIDELQQKESLTEEEEAKYTEAVDNLKTALPAVADTVEEAAKDHNIDISAIREKLDEYIESIAQEDPDVTATELGDGTEAAGTESETDPMETMPTDEEGNFVLPTSEGQSAIELPTVYFD